jgi:hypothetical protein
MIFGSWLIVPALLVVMLATQGRRKRRIKWQPSLLE